jgi:hypothetical protein
MRAMKKRSARLSEVDREALERALVLYRQRDAACRQQVDDLLKERDWFSVATLAAYGMQCERFKLRPWQSPPTEIDDPDAYEYVKGEDIYGRRAAARLLKRLLDAGLSRYEPDPIAALERAEGFPLDAAE